MVEFNLDIGHYLFAYIEGFYYPSLPPKPVSDPYFTSKKVKTNKNRIFQVIISFATTKFKWSQNSKSISSFHQFGQKCLFCMRNIKITLTL